MNIYYGNHGFQNTIATTGKHNKNESSSSVTAFKVFDDRNVLL